MALMTSRSQLRRSHQECITKTKSLIDSVTKETDEYFLYNEFFTSVKLSNKIAARILFSLLCFEIEEISWDICIWGILLLSAVKWSLKAATFVGFIEKNKIVYKA